MDIFVELTIIISIAVAIASIMAALKQPLINGHILTGILVGPYFLNILKSVEVVELFSKLGITVLLFIVGIGLNPKIIKDIGGVALVTGVGQVLFTAGFGYLISILLGFDNVSSIYIAITLTFSSTIIILKLLSDKGEIHTLYGKISLGFLLIQDLIATMILVIIASVSNVAAGENLLLAIFYPLFKGFLVLSLLLLFAHYILPHVQRFFASSPELLFLISIAWGAGIGVIYSLLGLSIETGALIAGVALSMTPYAGEMSSRLKPLRDFFIVIFFIFLGYQMLFDNISALIIPAVIFSVFVLIGNPIIVFILMNFLGYTKKTGFLAGLTVAQISEFSFILVALGLKVGHVNEDIVSVVTLVGIITISASTYMILYSDKIYKVISPMLSILEFRKVKRDKYLKDFKVDAIMFGCHRAGIDFIKAFRFHKSEYLVVDHDPYVIDVLTSKKINNIYGDASDVEFLDSLPLNKAKLIISTIPDFGVTLFLLRRIRDFNKKSAVIVYGHNNKESQELYEAGASYVVMPSHIGSNFASDMIKKFGFNPMRYKKTGVNHYKKLANIKAFTEK